MWSSEVQRGVFNKMQSTNTFFWHSVSLKNIKHDENLLSGHSHMGGLSVSQIQGIIFIFKRTDVTISFNEVTDGSLYECIVFYWKPKPTATTQSIS